MAAPGRVEIEGLALPANMGTLQADAALKEVPSHLGTVWGVRPDIGQLETIHTWVPGPDLQTTTGRGVVLAKCYAQLMTPQNVRPDKGRVIATLLGLICNVTPFERIMENGQIASSLRNAGFELMVTVIANGEQAHVLYTDPDVQRFLGTFSEGQQRVYLHDRRQQVVMMGPILLTIGKQVNPAGYSGWLKNRIRSFRGTLGLIEEECIWTDTQYPQLTALQMSHALLTSSFAFRRNLFTLCVSLSNGDTYLSTFFQEILALLQGTEMSHIMLLDIHILGHYLEFLRVRLVRSNMENLGRAWTWLGTLPTSERYYAKILYPKENTRLLQRNNFGHLVSVATAIACFSNPSMANYRGGQQDKVSAQLIAAVNTYLTRRLMTIPIAMMDSTFSVLGPEEQKAYRELVRKGTTVEAIQDVEEEEIIIPRRQQ